MIQFIAFQTLSTYISFCDILNSGTVDVITILIGKDEL